MLPDVHQELDFNDEGQREYEPDIGYDVYTETYLDYDRQEQQE